MKWIIAAVLLTCACTTNVINAPAPSDAAIVDAGSDCVKYICTETRTCNGVTSTEVDVFITVPGDIGDQGLDLWKQRWMAQCEAVCSSCMIDSCDPRSCDS